MVAGHCSISLLLRCFLFLDSWSHLYKGALLSSPYSLEIITTSSGDGDFYHSCHRFYLVRQETLPVKYE